MNPMALMKLMSAKNKFNANHPKVGAFFKAAFGSGLQEGTILELTVTKPDGEKMTTNLNRVNLRKFILCLVFTHILDISFC